MRKISVKELLSQWWDTHLVSRELLDALDWDQLLQQIGIEIDEYEGLVPVVVDHDNSGQTILVAFSVEK